MSLDKILAADQSISTWTKDGAGTAITSTLVSGKQGLDVNLVNASVVVSGTDIDIRDLSHTQDSVKIGDGTDFLAIANDGSIGVTQVGTWNVNLTDDSVADDAADSGNPFKVGSRAFFGALNAISASNDRADLLSDKYRRIFVNDAPQIAPLATAVVVGNVTAVALPATALAGRKRISIQNLGSNVIYVGDATVSTSSGTRVEKNSTLFLEAGDAVVLYAIASAGLSNDVRVLELA